MPRTVSRAPRRRPANAPVAASLGEELVKAVDKARRGAIERNEPAQGGGRRRGIHRWEPRMVSGGAWKATIACEATCR